MDRRGFIGSVIGSVAGMAFLAKLPGEPFQRIIKPYRILFRDSISGFTIQAPGVKSIEPIENGFRFIVEELNAYVSMSLDSAILLKPNGQVIKRSKFTCPAYMCNGDTLKVTQDLTIDPKIKVSSSEELVELMIKYPNGIPYGNRLISPTI